MTITRHSCACGWHRDRGSQIEPKNNQPEWDALVINHPRYGTITNAAAAALDIARHDCGEYQAAVTRLRTAGIGRTAA
jgi:hypothetical protein